MSDLFHEEVPGQLYRRSRRRYGGTSWRIAAAQRARWARQRSARGVSGNARPMRISAAGIARIRAAAKAL